jgi:hypothetical protein
VHTRRVVAGWPGFNHRMEDVNQKMGALRHLTILVTGSCACGSSGSRGSLGFDLSQDAARNSPCKSHIMQLFMAGPLTSSPFGGASHARAPRGGEPQGCPGLTPRPSFSLARDQRSSKGRPSSHRRCRPRSRRRLGNAGRGRVAAPPVTEHPLPIGQADPSKTISGPSRRSVEMCRSPSITIDIL